jgi:threonine dehydrogenase-like Zn-dependent dehydrogenase
VKQSLAAVLSAPRAIEVVPVPVGPRPAAGAWLEVEACGVCGSDWSWYAERPISAPFVPGHEIVGRITHTWGYHGNAAFEVGGRVAIEEALPCWSCAVCRSGRHRLCPRSTRYGGTPLATAPALWGGFSQYTYLAPGTSAHAVPSSLDADLATLFIPVSNGLSWVRSAGRLSPGESAAVIGVGQHGLACVAAARRCGSGTLVAVGRAGDQARLDAAVKLGADVIVDADREDWVAAVLAATDGLGADLLVDTAPGATDILAGAVRCGAVRCGAVRSAAGNAKSFRCQYHGWTYRNDGQLVGVPYPGRHSADVRERMGLLALPRVESYRGLIFASFSPGVPAWRSRSS